MGYALRQPLDLLASNLVVAVVEDVELVQASRVRSRGMKSPLFSGSGDEGEAGVLGMLACRDSTGFMKAGRWWVTILKSSSLFFRSVFLS